MSRPVRKADALATFLAAVFVAMLVGLAYRCHAVNKCASVCQGSSGYEITGLDGCQCTEWELPR